MLQEKARTPGSFPTKRVSGSLMHSEKNGAEKEFMCFFGSHPESNSNRRSWLLEFGVIDKKAMVIRVQFINMTTKVLRGSVKTRRPASTSIFFAQIQIF